jgi:hypothetical protein
LALTKRKRTPPTVTAADASPDPAGSFSARRPSFVVKTSAALAASRLRAVTSSSAIPAKAPAPGVSCACSSRRRRRELDQDAARTLGMEEADHPREPLARPLVDQRKSLRARRLELARDVGVSKQT